MTKRRSGVSFFRILLLFFCVLYALSSGCASSGTAEVPSWPGRPALRPQQALSKILAASLPDWHPAGPTVFYDEDSLFEYINGAAETYFAYDFLMLATREFVYAGDASRTIVVDVYDMRRPANAFGVYSLGRAPDADFISLAQEGYAAEDTVFFWKNRYFVEIYPARPFPEAKEVGLEFARAISARIPKTREEIPLLKHLPPQGLVEKSETYYLRSLLGHRFLKNGITAEYIVEGERFTIFLCEYGAPEEAQDAASLFQKEIEESEDLCEALAQLGEESFAGKAEYLGPVVVFRQGRFLAGAKSGKSKGSSLCVLQALSSRLPK
ncbi:MAG: hypothetical protein AMS15_09850 [Planctomycetes bacterium DG_23]|nr:MAG: hypothetical protein AMS15_09850 [Planctomycetes bacterium DG_23]